MIFNLTQHAATDDQIAAGVIEPSLKAKKEIQRLLTFEDIPTAEELESRAYNLAAVMYLCGQEWEKTADAEAEASGTRSSAMYMDKAMIGGAPYLMAPLERILRDMGFTPVYAFSRRESSEVDDGNGGIRKVAVFRHLGFVPALEQAKGGDA